MSDTGDTIATWTSQATSPVRTVVDVDDVNPPVLAAIGVPSTARPGTTVNVSAAASDVWSAPVTLTWDFGDGTTATGTSASHIYGTAGARTITLTAVDAVGNTAVETRSIEVSAPAAAAEHSHLGVTVPKQSWKKIRKARGLKVRCTLDAAGACA